MEDAERRTEERRKDLETATNVREAVELQRAFGSDVAQRFLALRGISGQLAQDALLENHDRRQAARRARPGAAA